MIGKIFTKVLAQDFGGGPPGALTNPLDGVDDVSGLLTKILEIVVQIGIPVVALALVYAGFLFVAARGNESKLSEAKTTLFWTVIGAAIVLGAFAIRTAICGTIESLGGAAC